MKNIAIAYGSTTGNTERVAGLIAQGLKDHNVTVTDVRNVVCADLAQADVVLLGSSTWGYGELQDDFADFIGKIDSSTFAGKPVAVFGCGDQASFSDVFCEAVRQIEEKIEGVGGQLILEGLRVDGDVEDQESEIAAFTLRVAEKIGYM